MLRQEAERNAQAGRRTRILNLGCGPAQEIQRFLRNEDLSDLCDVTLLDFNAETIEHTQKILNQVRTQSGRVTPISLLQRSVHQLLRQASTGDVDLHWGSYDVVYCAGLFDYLSQRVCRRLNDLFARLLAPGGLMVVTNVSNINPSRAFMEFVVEWNLIYRDDSAMMEIAPLNGGQFESTLKKDETGVNLFLEIRKRSDHAGIG
jgi:extracellular factor (EF) 3-hydroxypalmitic acid methyl ester biosynthesis protein